MNEERPRRGEIYSQHIRGLSEHSLRTRGRKSSLHQTKERKRDAQREREGAKRLSREFQRSRTRSQHDTKGTEKYIYTTYIRTVTLGRGLLAYVEKRRIFIKMLQPGRSCQARETRATRYEDSHNHLTNVHNPRLNIDETRNSFSRFQSSSSLPLTLRPIVYSSNRRISLELCFQQVELCAMYTLGYFQ